MTSSADIGGSPLLSYNLQYTSDSSNLVETWIWVDILGGESLPSSLLTSYTLTTAIVGGESYKFRVRAKNIWGYGGFSNIITIKAA